MGEQIGRQLQLATMLGNAHIVPFRCSLFNLFFKTPFQWWLYVEAVAVRRQYTRIAKLKKALGATAARRDKSRSIYTEHGLCLTSHSWNSLLELVERNPAAHDVESREPHNL
jgi:hypothetical protein